MQPQGITAYVHCSLMPTRCRYFGFVQPAWYRQVDTPLDTCVAWNSIGNWPRHVLYGNYALQGGSAASAGAGAGTDAPAQQAQVLAPQVRTRPRDGYGGQQGQAGEEEAGARRG
jgi:hypothetical protein